MNTKKTTIIGIVVVLVAVVGLVWVFTNGFSSTQQEVSKLDPVDVVKGFYDQWLRAAQDPANADPSQKTLAKAPILSKALRTEIVSAQRDESITTDPVLCQTAVPEGISYRKVFTNDDAAQVLVTSKDKNVTNQAIITLARYNDGWYINKIECSLGEFAPEREFSFEKEGYLLKGSIPEPYNPKNWHLVFEENGQLGNVAPLLFDEQSQCTDIDGNTSVCEPDTFTEATKVFIRGQMTEGGANVKQLQFVK